ncbi:MAG: hypothetical protein ACFE9L_21020 [Candidatus Hodarchaeota archaeon]
MSEKLWARCGNCDYEWQVRTGGTPRSCPRCKTNLTMWKKKPFRLEYENDPY